MLYLVFIGVATYVVASTAKNDVVLNCLNLFYSHGYRQMMNAMFLHSGDG